MIFHQHKWRASTRFDILHAVCVECDQITFHPWWPKWKVRKRYESESVKE